MAITRTAQDIIEAAFRLCGISIPTSGQLNDGLESLNEMVALWSAERLMIPNLVEEPFTLVVGTAVYTIGASGTFNTVRPMKIESSYLRDASNIDTLVDSTMSLNEYNRISDKTIRVRPSRLYYAPEFPLGKIHFDAPPDAAYTFRLFSWKPLSDLATLATSVSLPAEYIKAMRLSLAVDFSPELNVILDRTVIEQAIGAHITIRNLNKAPVSSVSFDEAITRELAR